MGFFLLTSQTAHAAFNIEIYFTGGLTPSQQAAFSDAEATWESLITGYQSGISLTGITIYAEGTAIDGGGGILAMAGISSVTAQAGWTLSTSGSMVFDSADLDRMEALGNLTSLVTHEMGHILGFGTLWASNGVYSTNTGRYTGANALSAYRSEFNQAGATYVPVELGGGIGTSNSHWDEGDGGGATGITNQAGQDMAYELMTGWFNTPAYISNTTVMSFRDIGFTTVNLGTSGLTVLPEPSSMGLLVLGLAGVPLAKRYRQRQ
jgi:Leishmanolysin/PEP-CTERM motif